MRLLTTIFLLTIAIAAAAQHQLLDSATAYQATNTRKAILFADSALKAAIHQKDTHTLAESLFILGKANYLNGEKSIALKNYLDAERYFAQTKDTAGIIRIQTDLCILYLKINKADLALKAIDLAIGLATQVNNKDLLGTALNNKGLIFSDNHQPDSAIRYFLQAYDNYNAVNSKRGMAYCLDYLASASMAGNKPGQAMSYLKQSIALQVACGDKMGEAVGINNIGELLLQQGKATEAIPYFKQAIDKARQIKFDQLEDNAWQMLAECYQKTGAYKDAYDAAVNHTRLQEKIVNESILKKTEELSAQYEAGKREQQNKLLREQNARQHLQLSRTRIIAIAITIMAAMLVLMVLQFYNRKKLKQEALFTEELRLVERAQANAIVDAEENERQRLSRELHDGIGQSLAAVRRNISALSTNAEGIHKSIELIDNTIGEVRQLSHEMMPPWLRNKTLPEAIRELAESVKENSATNVHLELTNATLPALDKVQVHMLYRCIQEILGNAMKHAHAATITIEMVDHADELSLMIYDDGKGFDVKTTTATASGIGLKNITSRIAYIGGNLQIDSFPGRGTTFNISIPLKQTT